MIVKSFSLILFSSFLYGCAVNSQQANVMPGVELSKYRTFFVIEVEDDRREAGKAIADQLADMGFDSSIGKASEIPESAEVLVRYDAKWSWDVTFFLLALNIRFLDAGSLLPLATATSEHSSINRKTKRGMAEEVLTNIFSGTANTAENDYFEPATADDMVVRPDIPMNQSLPITVQVIGYGVQLASDEAFNVALRTSLKEYRLFDSIHDDGQYILTVALNGLVTDETHLVVFGTVIFHNVTATATWSLTKKDSGVLLFSSEIATTCPETELDENKSVTDKTACAIRENLRSGITELAALDF